MKKNSENYSAVSETGAILEKRSIWQRLLIDFKKSPISARFGLIVIALYIFVAIFASRGFCRTCCAWGPGGRGLELPMLVAYVVV